MTEPRHQNIGLIGMFDDPDALLRAAETVRDAGFKKWDCHTPYPVHGLEEAMGLRSSPIPFLTMGAGFTGLLVAIAMTGGLSALHFPIRIGGKALFSWQAFVPIYFELFVLFAALATFSCIVLFGRLGRWHSPLHDSGVMADVTGSRFAIVLLAADPAYSEEKARQLLEAADCRDIRPLVEFEEEDGSLI